MIERTRPDLQPSHGRPAMRAGRPKKALMVCNEMAPRTASGIDVLPWREFLTRLWGGGGIKS